MADNLEFRESYLSDKVSVYQGTWQISVRDIDPSFLLKKFPESSINQVRWLTPVHHEFKHCINEKEQIDWITKKNDYPDPLQLIELNNPDDNKHWLTLEGFYRWMEKEPLEEKIYENPRREIWYQIKSYIVRSENVDELVEWLKDKNFEGRWMPESHHISNVSDAFLGEFPWSVSCQEVNQINDWTQYTSSQEELPHPVLVTTTEYMSEEGGFDCSIDETISALIPSSWLIKNMGLKCSRKKFDFVDSDNELTAFTPLGERLPKNCLISKEKLARFLLENNLEIIWTLLGERQLIGGEFGKWKGRMEISGVYQLKNGSVTQIKLNNWHNKPKE